MKQWLEGSDGVAKINVDATISRNNGRGASAATCCNDQGKYLGASVTIFEGRADLESLEAHACCEAFSLAQHLHRSSVRVATDCIATVNHLAGTCLGVAAPSGY